MMLTPRIAPLKFNQIHSLVCVAVTLMLGCLPRLTSPRPSNSKSFRLTSWVQAAKE